MNGRGSRRPKKLPVCVMRNRSDGCRSSPATSSKSAPFGIVTTGPRGSSDRVSSLIASDTQVIASARDATSRATRSCSAALAFVAVVSARRWAWKTRESRRSATQRTPVARAIAAAMRWVEGGGDVETTTSIPCSRTSRMPAGIAVTAQVAFSSGTTRRRSWSLARVTARSSPWVPASTSDGLPPDTPTYRDRWIHACEGMRRPSSRWIQRGSSGARTCVSIPIAGRYWASLSGRCTPPPPAGGK